MPDEKVTIESEPTQDASVSEQPVLNYEGETVEQLDERFARGEGVIAEEPPAEPEPEPQPDAEAQAEAEPVAQDESPPEEPEVDETKELIEELRLELQKRDADMRRLELLHGQAAGEAGFLRQQMRQQFSQPQPQSHVQPQPQDYDYPQEQPQTPPQPQGYYADPALQQQVAALEQSAQKQAVSAAWNDFLADHPEVSKRVNEGEEVAAQLVPRAQQILAPYANSRMTPEFTQKLVRTALDSSYADATREEMRKVRAEREAKRASQIPEQRKAKLAATVSASGASPAPKAKPKRIEDLTLEEAEAELIRLYGDGHTRRLRG